MTDLFITCTIPTATGRIRCFTSEGMYVFRNGAYGDFMTTELSIASRKQHALLKEAWLMHKIARITRQQQKGQL